MFQMRCNLSNLVVLLAVCCAVSCEQQVDVSRPSLELGMEVSVAPEFRPVTADGKPSFEYYEGDWIQVPQDISDRFISGLLDADVTVAEPDGLSAIPYCVVTVGEYVFELKSWEPNGVVFYYDSAARKEIIYKHAKIADFQSALSSALAHGDSFH